MNFFNYFTKKYFSIILIFSLLANIFIPLTVQAAPRTTPFTVGQTLDPGAESVEPCGPTDANCFPTAFTTSDEGSTLSSNILHINFV